MPVGKWKTFGECVGAQKKSGKSDESAKKICGAIEQNTINARKEASTVTKYIDNGRLYIRAFLLSADVNINRWGVTPTSLDSQINTFIGKPLVLTRDFTHPLPPEFQRIGATIEYDDEIVQVNDIIDHWLSYQEDYRIGNIIDIVKKSDTYFAIIEVTDEAAKDAFKNNDIPLFVSPAIAQLNPNEQANKITEWTGIHLALVSDPAYSIQKALVTNQCRGDESRCLLQLRQASIIKNKGLGCGFCRWETFKEYKNKVAEYDPVPIHVAATYDEFINSSIHFLEPHLETELVEQQQLEIKTNTNDNNNNNNSSSQTEVQKESTTKEEEETKTNEEVKDELVTKVANLQECVQIFQQNGIQDPNQAQQICQLAMQALMKSYGPQPGGNPAGNSQGMGPPQSGKFAEIEKEKVILEAQVEKLSEELKTFKKGNKTDAERIAELETTVNNLLTERKEKEIELYLVGKINDEKKRKEKIKRYAELNLSIQDLKDIYEEDSSTKSDEKLEKVANVTEEKPKGKVKLQVASTNEEEQENNNDNSIKDANSRIVSSFYATTGVN